MDIKEDNIHWCTDNWPKILFGGKVKEKDIAIALRVMACCN